MDVEEPGDHDVGFPDSEYIDQMYIENRNAIIKMSETEYLEHTAQSWLPLDLLNNSTSAILYPSMRRRNHEHMH